MNNDINNIFKKHNENIIIKVKIIPNSSINKIMGVYNDSLKISIAAPPVEGKANKKCITYLAKFFKIAKSKIEIVSGENSKNKVIKIYDISQKEFLGKLEKIV